VARINWPVAVLTVTVFAFYCVYTVSRQATMLTSGYDLGIFDQAGRQYARFHAPLVALKGSGYNIFADHFHPIIAVLAPLYWVWDTPYVCSSHKPRWWPHRCPSSSISRSADSARRVPRRRVRLRLRLAGPDAHGLRLP
jgi:hypothetical protein